MKYHYEGINISMTKQGQTKGSRKKSFFLSSRKKFQAQERRERVDEKREREIQF